MGKLDSLSKLKDIVDYVCKSNYLNCPRHVNHEENKKPVEGETYFKSIYLNNNFPGGGVWDGYTLYPPYKFINSLSLEELLQKFGLARIKGYYGDREFYQIDHNKEYDPFPDYRNTLLWEPEVVTDKNGEVTLEFYCSDINTMFLGHIEGVSDNGLFGVSDFKFVVRK